MPLPKQGLLVPFEMSKGISGGEETAPTRELCCCEAAGGLCDLPLLLGS